MSTESREIQGTQEEKEEGKVREIPLHNLDMRRLIQLDACTRCGECLLWCPVYDQDEKEGIIPRRKVIDFLKIARSQQGFLAKIMKSERVSKSLKSLLGTLFRHHEVSHAEIGDFVRNLYECSTCGQCEVVCPAHIDTVNLWEDLRRLIVSADYGPLESQKALEKSVKAYDNPWQQPRAGRTKWARRAKKDKLIQDEPRNIKKKKGKVLLFLGCTASYDANVRQVAVNTINILNALDIDYGVLGKDERCCGSVLLRMGDPEHGRLFRENIRQFNGLGIDTLISSCSGCFKTIKQDYPKVETLNFEVMHTVEFLARLLEQEKLTFLNPVEKVVTYHDPCHLGRATRGFDAPRTIMNAIPGLRLTEMPRNREYSRCCGAGGGLKAGYPDIQNRMAQRRIREAEETGAECLVSCCPFCFQGLNVGIMARGSHLLMKDMSSLVAESLLGYDVFEKAAKEAEEKAAEKARKKAEKREAAEKKETTECKSPEKVGKNAEKDSEKAKKKAEREAERAKKKAEREARKKAKEEAVA